MARTGKRNKERCYEHETEVVRIAQEKGFGAERAWASNGASKGWHPGVDIMVSGMLKPAALQAKRMKKMPKWMRALLDEYIVTGTCLGVVFREDKDENYIVLKYTDWLEGLAR